MRISTLKLTVSISFLVAMTGVFISCCFESLLGAIILGAVWALFYLIMTKLFAKCPHCGKPLGKNYLQIDLCPHCELPLD